MNKVPDFLVEKNPGLPLYSVLDPEFAPYGQVLDLGDVSALADAMRALPSPENGNCYAPSDDKLMALPETERIKRSVFGDMPIQAGYCNGRGFTLNAEEYHRCSEVNFTTTGLVLRCRVLSAAGYAGGDISACAAFRPLPHKRRRLQLPRRADRGDELPARRSRFRASR